MARATEVLGDRWTLLIVRDMIYGSRHFNELERGLPGIPKALLAERLRRLQQVGVVEREVGPGGRGTGYHLTEAGEGLKQVVDALIEWGAQWCFGEPPREDELDPVLLLWWMRDGIYLDRLPEQRVVVEFVFRGVGHGRYWMVLEREDISVCIVHPGYEADVLVKADLAALYEVWLGRVAFGDAVRNGGIVLEGVPVLVRAFPRWLALSPMAGAVRGAVGSR